MVRVSNTLLVILILLVISILVGCGLTKGSAEWHTEQGYKLAEQGRYDEAIEECTKAIELDSNLANAYANRALAYGLLQ